MSYGITRLCLPCYFKAAYVIPSMRNRRRDAAHLIEQEIMLLPRSEQSSTRR